jgi:hypothetical protein
VLIFFYSSFMNNDDLLLMTLAVYEDGGTYHCLIVLIDLPCFDDSLSTGLLNYSFVFPRVTHQRVHSQEGKRLYLTGNLDHR